MRLRVASCTPTWRPLSYVLRSPMGSAWIRACWLAALLFSSTLEDDGGKTIAGLRDRRYTVTIDGMKAIS
jgi:hypothetical protein